MKRYLYLSSMFLLLTWCKEVFAIDCEKAVDLFLPQLGLGEDPKREERINNTREENIEDR